MNKSLKKAGVLLSTVVLVALCYPQIGNGITSAESLNSNFETNISNNNSNSSNNNSNSAANKSSKAEVKLENETNEAADKNFVANPAEVSGKIDNLKNGATYSATAYALRGRTATGQTVRRGIIAADPKHLPLGTRVQISAGTWSGVYLVADTGGAIRGRKIDVWVPNNSEARKFGRRKVTLTVLSRSR